MKRSGIIISITLLSVAAGCISVSTPKREQRPAFAVESNRPSSMSPSEKPLHKTLRLRKFRAAEPYDSRRMYVLDAKTGEIKALASGSFAVTSAVAASDITRRWLIAAGIFSDVFDQSMIPPGEAATLDGWIDQACVIAGENGYNFSLKMTLWLTQPGSLQEIPQQRFDFVETYPVKETEAAEIAAAFGATLRQVLVKFETQLNP